MKKNAKRMVIMVFLLAVTLFAACKGSEEETPTPTAVPTQAADNSQIPDKGTPDDVTPVVTKELTSLEVMRLMGNGINLGNTMEAYGRADHGVTAEVAVYETAWGAPVTTQEMISGMKAAGFDSLRIPVAWTNTMYYEDGDYTIREDYLERVAEIVNYALKENMYVIVNDHWDGGWWGMFGSATEGTRNAAMELYVSMWTQIAEYFADYSDLLIFESANEELGFRLNDTDVAKDSGTLSEEECYEMTNQINQTFVDTIRSCSGNNKNRFLLIAGFGTDIENTCKDGFKMPTDSAKDKLLISVHYYEPSSYCIFTSLDSWGTKEEYVRQNELLAMMTKFTEQGYGVVIGECGVLMEGTNVPKNNTCDYLENFLNNCDLYGYCPMLWDCNSMYSRITNQIIDADVAEIYTRHSLAGQAGKTEEEIKTAAETAIQTATDNATSMDALDANTAMAWLMYNSSDWGVSYSVGDVYTPSSKTAGIEATDVVVEGEGVYTVALDLTGTSAGYGNSTVFMALGIANAEILYPGYVVIPQKLIINGEEVKMNGLPFTTSDDGICTRMNIYNQWVTKAPEEARTMAGSPAFATASLIDPATLGNIETISFTFKFQKK